LTRSNCDAPISHLIFVSPFITLMSSPVTYIRAHYINPWFLTPECLTSSWTVHVRRLSPRPNPLSLCTPSNCPPVHNTLILTTRLFVSSLLLARNRASQNYVVQAVARYSSTTRIQERTSMSDQETNNKMII